MRIDQLVHTLNYGDAISGEAISLQRILRSMGIQSQIYSVNAHPKVKQHVRHWECYAEDSLASTSSDGQRVLLLHYSIASPLNQLFLDDSAAKRVMIYHNLTPVSWFTSYNGRVANDLVRGRDELPVMLNASDLVLADSEFNRRELEAVGFDSARVLRLFVDEDKWSVPANPGIANSLKASNEKILLHVGRLAPNKRIEDIIKAFYFYHHKIERKSRLWLVGADIDTEIYSFELRRLISELRLQEAVSFAGSVADGELRAFYENADVYLAMSEHEGFCVPLLEAMRFSVPVIAYNSCAVGETLGDAGLLLSEKKPAEVAEIINMVITDTSLNSELIKRGRGRLADYSEAVFAKAVQEELLEPLASLFADNSSDAVLGAQRSSVR